MVIYSEIITAKQLVQVFKSFDDRIRSQRSANRAKPGKAWFPKDFLGGGALWLIRMEGVWQEGGKGPCVSDLNEKVKNVPGLDEK